MRVLSTAGSALPDTVVGFAPVSTDRIAEFDQIVARCTIQFATPRHPQERGLHQLPVGIELELTCGQVSNPHWSGIPVSSEIWKYVLRKLRLTVQVIHDVNLWPRHVR